VVRLGSQDSHGEELHSLDSVSSEGLFPALASLPSQCLQQKSP
jgi:hypothetical protein